MEVIAVWIPNNQFLGQRRSGSINSWMCQSLNFIELCNILVQKDLLQASTDLKHTCSKNRNINMWAFLSPSFLQPSLSFPPPHHPTCLHVVFHACVYRTMQLRLWPSTCAPTCLTPSTTASLASVAIPWAVWRPKSAWTCRGWVCKM